MAVRAEFDVGDRVAHRIQDGVPLAQLVLALGQLVVQTTIEHFPLLPAGSLPAGASAGVFVSVLYTSCIGYAGFMHPNGEGGAGKAATTGKNRSRNAIAPPGSPSGLAMPARRWIMQARNPITWQGV